MKSGNLNFLEPSGPLQACNGTDLPLPYKLEDNHHDYNFSDAMHNLTTSSVTSTIWPRRKIGQNFHFSSQIIYLQEFLVFIYSNGTQNGCPMPRDALRRSGHSDVAARSVSRGISAAAFTRDLLKLSRLSRRSRHAMPSKTAHSLLSRGLRYALTASQFSALMKARRFLPRHFWVVLAFWAGTESCWKTHSWPLKKVMLSRFTTPCSMSSWFTRTPISPLSLDNIKVVTDLMARPSAVCNKQRSDFVTVMLLIQVKQQSAS